MIIDLRNYKGSDRPQGFAARSFVVRAVTDADITEDDPIICIDNLVSRSTVMASVEAPFTPASNLGNPATHLRWSSGVAGAATLTVLTGGALVDYVAIARHNFFSAGLSVNIIGSSGGADVALSGAIDLTSDDAAIIRFDAGSFDSIKISISAGSVAPFLAVLYVGKLLQVPNGIPTGFTPLKYGVRTEVVSGQSQSGEFLGRSINFEGLSTSIPFQYIDGDWYRENLAPVVKRMRLRPFFFAWSPRHYPEEAGYCWVTNNPTPSIDTENGEINISLAVEGLAK